MRADAQRWIRRLNVVFLLGGVAALAWMLHRIGPGTIGDGMQRVGWGFALTCLAHFTSIVLDSVTLRSAAGTAGDAVRLRAFLRASLAGHAINESTPLAKLGEITKLTILAEHMPGDRAAAALIVQNFVMFAVNCAMITVAPLLAVVVLGVEGPVATLLVSAAAVFAVIGVITLVLMHRGFGPWPFRLLRLVRVGERRVERWERRWRDIEILWREATASRRHMRIAWLSGLASRLMSTTEIAIILALIGADHVLVVAALSLANGQLIGWLTAFVPLQAGTAEGGQYMLYAAVGLAAPMGVLVELVRKARRVVFICLGVALLGWTTFRQMLRRRTGRPPQ